mmetsp:Transcript_26929/g.45880  ORF Transcript_26929/g.45880 Transcript_26929/m.45880 type:complete len:291 (-) Transcript_26929:143-1015(-)
MIKRTIAMPRLALVLFVLASLARTPFASSVEAQSGANIYSGNRWLTYGCGSKNNGNRNLLSRILTHPCKSQPKESTASEVYTKNTLRESNTFLNITLGIIAGVASILGLLFFIDRETFTQVTGVKELPYYCDCSKYRIDKDDDEMSDPTPYEQDTREKYLSEETREYLAEKQGTNTYLKRPKRIFRRIFWCCFKTKDYDAEDKYHIPWTGSEDESEEANACNINMFWVLWEEFRLRFCWKPTKKYSTKDKYNINLDELRAEGKADGGESVESIQYAASSYESAEEGMAPW